MHILTSNPTNGVLLLLLLLLLHFFFFFWVLWGSSTHKTNKCHSKLMKILYGPSTTEKREYYYNKKILSYIFLKSFNLWFLLLMITLSYQTKTLIGFGSRQRLNPRSLIQLSETLPIKLTRTHKNIIILKYVIKLKWHTLICRSSGKSNLPLKC